MPSAKAIPAQKEEKIDAPPPPVGTYTGAPRTIAGTLMSVGIAMISYQVMYPLLQAIILPSNTFLEDYSLPSYYRAGFTSWRSEYPVFNALANHEFLNHAGDSVDHDSLTEAFHSIGLSNFVGSILSTSYLLNARVEHRDSDSPDAALSTTLDKLHFDTVNNDQTILLRCTKNDCIEPLTAAADEEGWISAWAIGRVRRAHQFPEIESSGIFSYLDTVLQAEYADANQCALMTTVLGRAGRIHVDTLKAIYADHQFPDNWTPPRHNVGVVLFYSAVAKCEIARFLPF